MWKKKYVIKYLQLHKMSFVIIVYNYGKHKLYNATVFF